MTTIAEPSLAVAEWVRQAGAAGTPVRIVGAGQWLDAGRPCGATSRLDLGAHTGVTEYEPGDLTLTARAGTTLAEIAGLTAREGQWLTLDPFGSDAGTIGATIATGSYGPLASAFGTPRDHLLGCEVVAGAGEIVRSGGRVVKNVAGFDLPRLMCGAWGTLGALTEVTVRLRARPEVDRTLAVALSRSGDDCASAWRWLRDSPFTPLAAELCSPTLARLLDLGDATRLLLRVGGNEALVRAAEREVAGLGEVQPVGSDVWDRMRAAEPAGAVVVRLGSMPADVGARWASASGTAERSGGFAHAALGRGVIRCIVPVRGIEEENGWLRGIIGELQSPGSRIFERLPPALWADVSSPVTDPLSVGVRRAFDPAHLLNPGILGETA